MNRRFSENSIHEQILGLDLFPFLACFKAIVRICMTSTGFSAISDVDVVDGRKKLDMQESFVFAEVLKYVYLLHLKASFQRES